MKLLLTILLMLNSGFALAIDSVNTSKTSFEGINKNKEGVSVSADINLYIWDGQTPNYTLFKKGIIDECPKCETFAIIASTDVVSDELTSDFKKLVEKVDINLTHQGVIMHRKQLILQVNEITGLNCRLPRKNEKNVFFYADRKSDRCVKLNYSSEDALRSKLERVYAYFDDKDRVFVELNVDDNNDKLSDAIDFFGDHWEEIKELVSILTSSKIYRKN